MRFLGLVITTDRRIDRLMAFEREMGRMAGERIGRLDGIQRGMAASKVVEAILRHKPSRKGAGGGRDV